LDFAFTPAQLAFQDEVRAFFKREMTPEVVADIIREESLGNVRSPMLEEKLYQTGWLTMQWPVEYGGQGRGPMDAAIFNEEIGYNRVLDGAWGVSVNLAGNALLHFGTPEQKAKYIPWIVNGRMVFCQGFTEPEAGSDLASLKTRALLDGDEFVVNGQKVFTGRAHMADYIYLAVRTDPDAPKHRGLSLLLVDMKTPGIQVTPFWMINGHRYNQVFFDDVRVPKSQLLGELNQGWRHITTTLNIERSGSRFVGWHRRNFEDLVNYTKTTIRSGQPLSKRPDVRRTLAELAIEMDVARLLSYRVAWLQDQGHVPTRETSIAALWNKEQRGRVANAALKILGLYGQLKRGSSRAPVDGEMEALLRDQLAYLHSAGSVEVQRNIIAIRGLGLPR
jgi:alkylation response protein AidB-like acyl-CoA dehydrogenase